MAIAREKKEELNQSELAPSKVLTNFAKDELAAFDDVRSKDLKFLLLHGLSVQTFGALIDSKKVASEGDPKPNSGIYLIYICPEVAI